MTSITFYHDYKIRVTNKNNISLHSSALIKLGKHFSSGKVLLLWHFHIVWKSPKKSHCYQVFIEIFFSKSFKTFKWDISHFLTTVVSFNQVYLMIVAHQWKTFWVLLSNKKETILRTDKEKKEGGRKKASFLNDFPGEKEDILESKKESER